MPKKVTIPTPNKNVIVSFKYAWSRQQEMSVHEQRIILRIIEQCHKEALQGVMIRDFVGENAPKLEHGLFDVTVTLPISSVIFSNREVSEIKEALSNLRKRSFTYENENGDWGECGFIEKPEYRPKSGIIRFNVDNRVWDILTMFAQGYREFELNKALSLPTTYALRFYMLMSGQKRKITLPIEKLKSWLGIPEEKYKEPDGKGDRIDNLEDRVLKPAQKALDEICPYSFIYAKLRENPKNPRSKVLGFEIYPKYIPKNRDTELETKKLQAQISLSGRFGMLPDEASDYLLHVIGFTKDGLNSNKDLFIKAAHKIPDLIGLFADLWQQTRRKGKGIPYFIGALKNRVESK